ncbi:MAG: type II toxin-antitoxin system HicA family toxin [Paludibacteraceae bacterium]|nr:type II toxin-antitoxin system HicA family toxin [Paludibacteraceae bacterium]
MKYKELERKLKSCGCYPLDKQMNGHLVRFSPITNQVFKMSNHGGEEVAKGTLKAILKSAGIK